MKQRSVLSKYLVEPIQTACAGVVLFASAGSLVYCVKWARAALKGDLVGAVIVQDCMTLALACAAVAALGAVGGLGFAYAEGRGLLPPQAPVNKPGKQE